MITNASAGQMTWRPDDAPLTGILHLRHHPSESWRPYTEFPQYVRPDPPGFSEGYATFLTLLKQQWQLL